MALPQTQPPDLVARPLLLLRIGTTPFEKIRAADAFVADLTTINSDRNPDTRACPNPNVLLELGHAVAHLGWNRVIMLFNQAHGKFPGDVPFDFQHHRVSPYEFSKEMVAVEEPKKKRQASVQKLRKPLFDLIYEALNLIILKCPPKPSEEDEISPDLRKRRRDAEMLRKILETIHVPTMDQFLEEIQIGVISYDIVDYWEDFHETVSSNLFHLYDQKLAEIVKSLHNAWEKILSFSGFFEWPSTAQHYKFHAPGDVFTTLEQEKAWIEMQEAARETEQAFTFLLEYVRENFVEIDVQKTSAEARSNLIQFRQGRASCTATKAAD